MTPEDPMAFHLAAGADDREALLSLAPANFRRVISVLHPVNLAPLQQEIVKRNQTSISPLAREAFRASVTIDVASLTQDTYNFLTHYGFSVSHIQKIFSDTIGFGMDGAASPTFSAQERDDEAAIFEGSHIYRFNRHMHPMVQAGGLVTIDPATGSRLISTHSFQIGSLHIAYRFEGVETFYIVVGGIIGFVRYICFPRLNCIVLADVPGESEGHKTWSQNLYRDFMAWMCMHALEIPNLFRQQRHMVGVAIGSWANLGHFMWQELAGLDEIIAVHGAESIRHLLLGPHTYLPVKEIFPELSDRPSVEWKNPSQLLEVSYQLPYQYIRPTHVFIGQHLRARIFRAAEAAVPATTRQHMVDICRGHFVIWVTLRAHNKTWVSQVPGYAHVLNKIAREIRSILVIFDGWTDTREIAHGIRERLGANVLVEDTIGCELYETFLWARMPHVYAGVLSTGLHFPGHFGGKPGVGHANSIHLRQVAFWEKLAPGNPGPVLFSMDEVTDISKEGIYDNYDLDPELLYLKMRALIAGHYPEWLQGSGPCPS